MRPTPFNAFVCGVFFHAGLVMAFQDWYGLEGYIVLIRNNWVHLHWVVGASLALFWGYNYYTINKQYKEGK